jgi:uncharacterized protein YbjT (DUF2867 family)
MASYLVTQATGQQSRWVITHLLAAGLKVHAVVRDAQKVPPILKDPAVTIFQGESKNYEDIYRAAQGCKGVFLNTFPIPGLEAQQANTVVEACKKAGVESIVAATSFLTGDRALWDDATTEECGLREYYLSKAEVEEAVRQAAFKAYTILRPAVIYQDFLLPGAYQNFPELPTHGELAHCLNDGIKMPHTDAHDVGKYAAAALRNPAIFGGQEIDLGNEVLTIEEVRDILAKVSGRDVGLRKRTPAEVEGVKATVFGQRFHLLANARDFSAVGAAAKENEAKFGIPVTSLEVALQRDRALLLECLPAE